MEIEKRNAERAQINFERAKELYRLGQTAAYEFRRAQTAALGAKFRLNEAKYDLKKAELELKLIAGIYFAEEN